MKLHAVAALAAAFLVTSAPSAFAATQAVAARAMPANTLLTMTPTEVMSSSRLRMNDQVQFVTVGDVTENGVVVIPRGSSVTGRITFITGRAIGGKSGKFDVTFETVNVGGRSHAIRGTHRQEGSGNTTGALLGSMFISGRSANMRPGQMVTAFTADSIPY